METKHTSGWKLLRFLCFTMLFAGLLLTTIYRAFSLNYHDGEELSEKAQQMYLREDEFPGARGVIYDRDMNELAVTLTQHSLYADPKNLPEGDNKRRELAKQLAAMLSLDTAALEEKLLSKKRFVWIKRMLSPDEYKAVQALEIPGLDTRPEYRRFYPNRELAAHILGFVGIDGNAEGVERLYNEVLSGGTSNISYWQDARGKKIFHNGIVTPLQLEGNSLVLTISSHIQYIAERELQKAIEKTKAEAGMVIVTEPSTGEILALANWPTFNPNDPGKSKPEERRNRVFTDSFEPGSTFKSFVYAAGIQENLINPEELVDCGDGDIKVGKHTIHDSHPVGTATWTEALAESSNICAYYVGAKLGPEKLYNYLKSFGFGAVSSSGFPGEISGVLHPFSSWREINLATISFGQGVTVNALQEVMAMGAIANGGHLLAPKLVKKLIGPDGTTKQEFSPTIVKSPVSDKTSETIKNMLINVTRPGGTAERAAIPDYTVAGKTGTAQKATNGRYQPGQFISSFVGFAPVEKPRLAIAVILDNPVGQYYGGQVAAPVFKTIAEDVLHSMGVPASPDLVLYQDKDKSPKPVMLPHAKPVAAQKWEDRISTQVPDFTGLTMKDVLRLAKAQKLSLRIEGTGIAFSQEPAAGNDATQVTVRFQEKTNAPLSTVR